MMELGIIDGLWRYPVKSLAAEPLAAVRIESDGLAGDRRTALIVADAGHARSGKPFRGKEHRLLHTLTSSQAACELGVRAGVDLQPVSGGRYFDAQPVSLLWDSWLRDVEALAGRPLDPLRYRPNLFVRAAAGFTAREDDLVGMLFAVGEAQLRVVATIKRCVTTTYDVVSGVSDPSVLRTVVQQRANTVRVYCAVERPGDVRRGDAVAASGHL